MQRASRPPPPTRTLSENSDQIDHGGAADIDSHLDSKCCLASRALVCHDAIATTTRPSAAALDNRQRSPSSSSSRINRPHPTRSSRSSTHDWTIQSRPVPRCPVSAAGATVQCMQVAQCAAAVYPCVSTSWLSCTCIGRYWPLSWQRPVYYIWSPSPRRSHDAHLQCSFAKREDEHRLHSLDLNVIVLLSFLIFACRNHGGPLAALPV